VVAVSPLARLQVENVKRQKLPAVLANELDRRQDEVDLGVFNEKGYVDAREAGAQDLCFGRVVFYA